ncbi:FtsX-like permease family protein [Candidatus Poribacteria bacterium]|nr:FtsX-like permease family protein [Candidatus Poribacteria bacterium]
MSLIDGILIGFAAIRANKMRTLLTMLGIIIGIASVLAVIAIGDGAKEVVLQDVQKLGGANQFTIYRRKTEKLGKHNIPIRTKEYLNYDDVLAIEAECPSVSVVTPRIANWKGMLFQSPNGNESRAGYHGIDSSFLSAMDWKLHEGRFITDEDVKNATRICVLGDEVASDLFGRKSPLGQEIKIARNVKYYNHRGKRRNRRLTERYTVVGTMTPRGRSLRFGWSFDSVVFVPISTTQQRVTGNDHIEQIVVYANTVDDVPKAVEEVREVIRKRHNGEDKFVKIFEMRKGIRELEKISKMIKIALGSIAGFSLLVGGIGIMNMMLVTVTERTREIGLRKALGAKPFDIMLQFLIESVVMCTVAGIIGICIGIFLGEGLSVIAVKIAQIVPEWPSVVSTKWILISVLFSGTIGVSFGLYSAIKASILSPIEALRKE